MLMKHLGKNNIYHAIFEIGILAKKNKRLLNILKRLLFIFDNKLTNNSSFNKWHYHCNISIMFSQRMLNYVKKKNLDKQSFYHFCT